jgi:cytochrome b
MTPAHDNGDTVPVWSAIVRLSHWLIAAIVLFDLFNDSGQPHRYAGYVALAIVVLRLAHGLTRPIGDPAHVGLPSWADLRQHVRELASGQVHRSLGHNPAGLCMALLLWALVAMLGVTGWMSQQDRFWGEEWLANLHIGLAQVLQVCVLLHWVGVALMSRLQKENLLKAMVTGRKPKL